MYVLEKCFGAPALLRVGFTGSQPIPPLAPEKRHFPALLAPVGPPDHVQLAPSWALPLSPKLRDTGCSHNPTTWAAVPGRWMAGPRGRPGPDPQSTQTDVDAIKTLPLDSAQPGCMSHPPISCCWGPAARAHTHVHACSGPHASTHAGAHFPGRGLGAGGQLLSGGPLQASWGGTYPGRAQSARELSASCPPFLGSPSGAQLTGRPRTWPPGALSLVPTPHPV